MEGDDVDAPAPNPRRGLVAVATTDTTLRILCSLWQDGKQINCNDPDDKMGGIDYLRLDKTKDKSYAFDPAFDSMKRADPREL